MTVSLCLRFFFLYYLYLVKSWLCHLSFIAEIKRKTIWLHFTQVCNYLSLPLLQDVTQGQFFFFFKYSLLFIHSCGENSWIYIFPKYYLKIWTASSMIWTLVAVSIFYNDHHYTITVLISHMYHYKKKKLYPFGIIRYYFKHSCRHSTPSLQQP